MARRGDKRQLDRETEYWLLIKSGIGTVAACRAVGITRKTGYRRRPEVGGVPPVVLGDSSRTSRFLSLLERQRIAALRTAASASGRSPADSTGARLTALG